MSTLFANAHVVTMDDDGTELDRGWLLVEDGIVQQVGDGERPEADEVDDLQGAVVTPGLINTHHHLWQNLTRARAQEENLFGWLKTLYPVWAAIDEEAEYAAARCGLAELALSGCTTVFDHHYLFPPGASGLLEAEIRAARELGVRIVASRGSMDLGESDGGLPPDAVVEHRDDVLAATEAAARLADGAAVEIAVAPCSPFSVTKELMRESAELARRLGLRLHTHLAETVEEEEYARSSSAARRSSTSRSSAGSRRTSGARTASTCPLTTSPSSGSATSASPTVRARTCASAPGSRRCASCSMPACASASASTGRRRTSAATSSWRSSRRCSSPGPRGGPKP